MKHSLIIPTYNREKFVVRSLQSALEQSIKLDEIIIVDDGSTDNTRTALEAYIDRDKVRYYYQENKGVSSARNLGIEKSQGDWIHFLDSDDLWLPNKLKLQKKYIQKHIDIKWLHGNEVWYRDGKILNQKKKHKKEAGDIFIRSLELCLISPSTVCIHRSLFEELGTFNEDFVVCEDYDLWLRFLLKYPVGFVNTAMIHKQGGHADQLSQRYKSMDYYRVRSMNALDGSAMKPLQQEAVNKRIIEKCQILLNGYQKHNNLKNYKEIYSIYKLRNLQNLSRI